MRSIVSVLFLLLSFSFSVLAQHDSDFGNDVDRKSYRMFTEVECVKLIEVNDGIRPISFDSTTEAYVAFLKRVTAGYMPNRVTVWRNGTRVVVADRLSHGPDVARTSKTIFLIARDEKSYVAVFTDGNAYTMHFSRELKKEFGAAYDGRADPKILGAYPNIDQMTLCDVIRVFVPWKKRKETETK